MPKDKALVDYAAQLSERGKNLSERIQQPSGNYVRMHLNKKFIAPDGTEGATLSMIVLDFIAKNTWYDRPYDKENPSAPACFGIDPIVQAMLPHEKAPLKQAEACQDCPQNRWGSADTGNGKACQNRRDLAMITPEDPSAELLQLTIPPASIKFWDKYVTKLNVEFGLDAAQVVTEISFDEDQGFNSPRFKMISKLSDDEVNQFGPRLEEAGEVLRVPPNVDDFEAAKL